MGQFIQVTSVVDEHRNRVMHINSHAINHYERALEGSIGETVITLAGAKASGGLSKDTSQRRVFIAETVDQLSTLLNGRSIKLRHLSGMSRSPAAPDDVFVLSTQVRLVTPEIPRPMEGKVTMATIEFVDGSDLDVDDADALIAIL